MDTKICSKCNRELPLEMFNYRNKSLEKRHSICSECLRIYKRESYHRNYNKNKDAFNERRRNFTKEIKEFRNNLKKSGCIICNESNPCCLDFHHIDRNTKNVNIAELSSKDRIIEEFSKCVVLCSNCHRKVHAGYINLKNYLHNE